MGRIVAVVREGRPLFGLAVFGRAHGPASGMTERSRAGPRFAIYGTVFSKIGV